MGAIFHRGKPKFVSLAETIKIARERHGLVVTRQALLNSLKSIGPEFISTAGKPFYIREDKIIQLLSLVPLTAVVPEGYSTVKQIITEANRMDLHIDKEAIYRKLHSWLKKSGRDDRAFWVVEGLAQDAFFRGGNFFIPSRTRAELLKWMRLLRKTPVLAKVGYLTSIVSIAREFGVRISAVHDIPGIVKMKIGKQSFLNGENARYARQYLAGSKRGDSRFGVSSKLVPPSGTRVKRQKGIIGKNVF